MPLIIESMSNLALDILANSPLVIDGILSNGELLCDSRLDQDHTFREFFQAAANKRILLVDDCQDTRYLLSHLLENIGFDVFSVDCGIMCLDTVVQYKESHTLFDAILLDLGLPDIDGYETSRILRKMGYRGLIIAITANELPVDRVEYGLAGCNYFLPKQEIHSKLLEYLERGIENSKEISNLHYSKLNLSRSTYDT